MRVHPIVILVCFSLFGADSNGVRVLTTTKTNVSGSTSTKDIFTRAGQTNLVRDTRTKSGVVQIRIHRFYHRGALVGMFTSTQDSNSTTSMAGCPYGLDFEYGPSNQLKYAAIVGDDGVLLDGFACTNGVLYPVPSSQLSDAAGIAADTKKLMDPDRKLSPAQFHRKVEEMLEKYDRK